MRRLSSFVLWVVGSLASGCAPGLEVAVDVRTDLVSALEFDRVEVSLDGAPAAVSRPGAAEDFRVGVRTAEFSGLSRGRHEVVVRLALGERTTLARRVALRLEGSVILPVVLTRDCRGVECPGSGTVTDSECLGGRCVEPGCSPLDPTLCAPPECMGDGDCASATDCAEPRCAEGVCLEVSRQGACPAGEACVPGDGCVVVPGRDPSDAGPPDAGSMDSGPPDAGAIDAGPPDAGAMDDAGPPDAGLALGPPSCATPGPGRTDCGPAPGEDCCVSPRVTGGMFYRSYDGVSSGFMDSSYPATVSTFLLDKYEVTVGRFRQFVAAVEAGWRPTPGEGRHTHLNGGAGLANSGPAGGYESGWDPAWTAMLPTTAAAWTTALSCDAEYSSWTDTAGANEGKALNCLTWTSAQAFCLWDGGFLPSEAEWNYAASGGDERRVYPWSSPPGSTSFDPTRAVYGPETVALVGSRPAGDGRYGQSDLAGNVTEWALDEFVSPYASGTCTDCSHLLPASSYRALRGGGFASYAATQFLASSRNSGIPTALYIDAGARCARTP